MVRLLTVLASEILVVNYILPLDYNRNRSLHMDGVRCTRCGYDDIAVVKKELIPGGGTKKTYRCPRCSNTWEEKSQK